MLERVKEEIEKLKKRKNVLGIFLAGSFARNEAHPFSDVDLFVLVKRGIKQRLSDPWQLFRITYLTEKELRKRFWRRDWIFSRCLILSSKILYDPKGILKRIKEEAKKYPEEIRQFELRANVYHAKNQLSRARFAFQRKDFPSAVYFLMRCAEEILFFFYVFNRLFLPSERKIFEERKKIKIKPKNFEKRLITGGCLDLSPKKIERNIRILESLVNDLEEFYKKEEKNWREEYLTKLKEILK
jgi:predicted nucleotidyltransferase